MPLRKIFSRSQEHLTPFNLILMQPGQNSSRKLLLSDTFWDFMLTLQKKLGQGGYVALF